jgi:AP-1 complex subunit gamma-1
VAGAFVDQNVINHFIKLVTTGDTAVHHYATSKLYNLIKDGSDLILFQEGLLQAAFWCMGEYGDILTKVSQPQGSGFGVEEEADAADISSSSTDIRPTEAEIFDLVSTIFRGPYGTSDVKEYGITCLVKLSSRFTQEPIVK